MSGFHRDDFHAADFQTTDFHATDFHTTDFHRGERRWTAMGRSGEGGRRMLAGLLYASHLMPIELLRPRRPNAHAPPHCTRC
ncbi:hypothetical protein ABIE67_008571 [Streptomyces sp. V4I8]